MAQQGQNAQENNTKAAERIYQDWDAALGAKDVEAAVKLYAPDGSIESPLVQHLLGTDTGICRGHDDLRHFITIVFQRTPAERRRYRTGFFTDGRILTWEYPRETPGDDQMDLVEVMEVNDDGLIQRHRVYWGWYALGVLPRH